MEKMNIHAAKAGLRLQVAPLLYTSNSSGRRPYLFQLKGKDKWRLGYRMKNISRRALQGQLKEYFRSLLRGILNVYLNFNEKPRLCEFIRPEASDHCDIARTLCRTVDLEIKHLDLFCCFVSRIKYKPKC